MKWFSRLDGIVLLVAIIFPFFLTFVYFVLLAGSPGGIQKLAYSVGKILQFALPVFWVGVVCREHWFVRRFQNRGILEGVIFGIAVSLAMLLIYFLFSFPGTALGIDSAARFEIRNKIQGFGVNNKQAFFLLAVFYSVIHSGLEEYYWRWFVFGRLRRGMSWLLAAIISSLGFTAHHVLLLGTYFGYASPLCWLGSLGVAVGGLYWAWLYKRNDSIWGVWISHGIIDAAIFTIGFIICFMSDTL
ncbi:MAG: CPBP family intramembrane metalloprotease [Planctomycetaceae bacterium]|jgi:membrane protease YdiL (CAAX protease family)|nr:CPBP family intramembrane metalloprotease [Planctomycetaceae bacterium]